MLKCKFWQGQQITIFIVDFFMKGYSYAEYLPKQRIVICTRNFSLPNRKVPITSSTTTTKTTTSDGPDVDADNLERQINGRFLFCCRTHPNAVTLGVY